MQSVPVCTQYVMCSLLLDVMNSHSTVGACSFSKALKLVNLLTFVSIITMTQCYHDSYWLL
jgi:hypothetical protein